jgi:hypothetical protein
VSCKGPSSGQRRPNVSYADQQIGVAAHTRVGIRRSSFLPGGQLRRTVRGALSHGGWNSPTAVPDTPTPPAEAFSSSTPTRQVVGDPADTDPGPHGRGGVTALAINAIAGPGVTRRVRWRCRLSAGASAGLANLPGLGLISGGPSRKTCSPHSLAVYVWRPRLDYEYHAVGLDRNDCVAHLSVVRWLHVSGHLSSLADWNGCRPVRATDRRKQSNAVIA